MDKKIYLITDGQYDDYGIETVLFGPPDQNLQDLFAEFHKFTGHSMDSCWYGEGFIDRADPEKAWQIKLSDEYGLTRDGTTHYATFASEAALFAEWLVRTRGFEKPDWNEINLQQVRRRSP